MKLTRIAVGLLLIPVCTNIWAANTDLSGTFKTIKNVTVVETTAMVVNGLYLTSGDCTMQQPTVSSNFPGETVMKLSNATSTLSASADIGLTPAGPGCAGDDGIPGVYEIEGSSGAAVNITLTSGTTTGITFAPVGCAGDYDGSPDGDACTPIPNNSATEVTLATTGDQTVSAGNGVPVAGFSYLALGGQVTNSVGLTAATGYPVSFDITVTY